MLNDLEDGKWLKAQKYFEDLSNFNVRDFIDHIKPMSKMDWCKYMLEFNNILHKDDFMKDLLLYSVSYKNGLRKEDTIKENSHFLAEYLEEIKKETIEFQQYAIQSLMPIRYYFKEEMKSIVSYFNDNVDKSDLDEDKKKRKKFRLHDI